MIRKLIATAVVAGAVITAAVPASAGGSSSSATIADIVERSGNGFDRNAWDYDTLNKALDTAGLKSVLDGTTKYTVFAPNDRAFALLARDLGFTGSGEQATWDFLVAALTDLGGGDPIPVLQLVLKYHVADGVYGPLRVLFSHEIPTLADEEFGVRGLQLVDKDPEVRNPYLNLLQLNIKASNGVVHGITRVLLPVNV